MKKLVVVLTMAMFLIPAALFGQQVKGDKELGLSGSMTFMSSGGSTSGNGNVFGSLGFFATRQAEIKLGFGMGFNATADPLSGATTWSSTPQVFGGFAYNFAAEGRKAFPYVGADVLSMGTVGGGTSTWTNFIRPNGGVKYFFKRNVAFDMNFGYDKVLQSGSGTTIDARFGFLFVF